MKVIYAINCAACGRLQQTSQYKGKAARLAKQHTQAFKKIKDERDHSTVVLPDVKEEQ